VLQLATIAVTRAIDTARGGPRGPLTAMERAWVRSALGPAGVVAQARRLIDLYGFRSIKPKGGVFPPDEEIAAIRALAEAFPRHAAAAQPQHRLFHGDFALRRPGAGRRAGVSGGPDRHHRGDGGGRGAGPDATGRQHVRDLLRDTAPPGIEQGAVGVVLSGRHYRGGLRRNRELAAVCETFGIGVSTHSNFHLGIGLAAMTHVAAVVPNLTYACDTHYPWNGQDDIVVPGVLEFVDGGVPVPTGPGLGVEPDQDAPAARHRTFLEAGRERRDDTGYMRRVDPAYDLTLPRW
jgi:glucarate dehydratase